MNRLSFVQLMERYFRNKFYMMILLSFQLQKMLMLDKNGMQHMDVLLAVLLLYLFLGNDDYFDGIVKYTDNSR